MLANGRVRVGDRVFVSKSPDLKATIVNGDEVEFEGQRLPINAWGQRVAGWKAINIYESVTLERTGQPLKTLRESVSEQ